MSERTDEGEIWARQWEQMVSSLAAFGDDGRLRRGQDYVEKGQVKEIAISIASISARVSGGRLTPYEVSVQIRPIPAAGWHQIFTRLVQDAELAEQLAAGLLPARVEDLFLEFGNGLMPTADELDTACDCPDWASPCKHAYAVLTTTARLIAENPLHLLMLRGLPQAIWLERSEQSAARSRALPQKLTPSLSQPLSPIAGANTGALRPAPDVNDAPLAPNVGMTTHAKWIDPHVSTAPWETHPTTGKPLSPAQALWFAAQAGESAFWYGPAPAAVAQDALPAWDPLVPTAVDDLRAGYAVYKWGRPPFQLPGPDAMTTLRDLYRRASERATDIIEEELGYKLER